MTSTNQFAALLGFLFVAAWVAYGFGDALLCLLGAGVAYAAVAFYRGELDLGALQDRLGPTRSSGRPGGSVR